MNVAEYIHDMAVRARAAAGELAKLSTEEKNAALEAIASALEKNAADIKAANAVDVANAKANGLAPAMVDRLMLTDARFQSMVDGVRHIATLPDPVGEELWTRERPSGITIKKVRVPFTAPWNRDVNEPHAPHQLVHRLMIEDLDQLNGVCQRPVAESGDGTDRPYTEQPPAARCTAGDSKDVSPSNSWNDSTNGGSV